MSDKTVLDAMLEFTEEEKDIVMAVFERTKPDPYDVFKFRCLIDSPKQRKKKRNSHPEIKRLSEDKLKAFLYVVGNTASIYDMTEMDAFRKAVLGELKWYWSQKGDHYGEIVAQDCQHGQEEAERRDDDLHGHER